MVVEVLGTGSALGELPTAYLIEERIMIDVGYPIIQKVIKNNKIEKIDTIFLTHMHMDHISGIELLIYYLIHKNKKIDIYAGEDFINIYKTLKCSKDINGKYQQPFKYINISETTGMSKFNQIENKNIYITISKNKHMNGSIESFSFTFQKGFTDLYPKIIISGDTDEPINTNNKILEKMNGYLFHDMGWTGLEDLKEIFKAHPTEEEIFNTIGDSKRVFGIHTESNLKYYKKAETKIYNFL
jgi:ribonuclease BN (tRNA processing enzyme)